MSKRVSWTCAGCAVDVSYPNDDSAPEQPAGWAKVGRKWLCLNCRREQAMDEAAAKSADGYVPRRQALIEFELVRDPEATEVEVAKRAQCSSATVRKVRREMREDGRLAPA